MFYVYVLESIHSKTRYVGTTNNLRRRLSDHNSGNGGEYTGRHGHYKLIYYEAYLGKKDASQAEKFYKTGYGREILTGKLGNYLSQ